MNKAAAWKEALSCWDSSVEAEDPETGMPVTLAWSDDEDEAHLWAVFVELIGCKVYEVTHLYEHPTRTGAPRWIDDAINAAIKSRKHQERKAA